MIEKERLIKAPTITAEEVADDDYIMIDSPTLGVRKYLASKLLPEPYLYKWDFTKSLVDEIKGVEASLSDATRDDYGVHISSSSSKCILFDREIDSNGLTLEVEVGDIPNNWGAGTHGRFLMYDNSNGYIYRGNGIIGWSVYTGGWKNSSISWPFVDFEDIFANKTVKFVFHSDSFDVYLNDALIQTFVDSYKYLFKQIGSNSQASYNFTIKTLKVYTTPT
jgi:hypothetical protein